MKNILIIILTLICGCSYNNTRDQNKNDTENLKVIDLLSPPESEITNLSDIASSADYIPLQTSNISLISYIADIKTNNDKIYLFPLKENQILCFDKTGKYLYKLAKEGMGQGEYTNIGLNFDLNTDGNLFILNVFRKLLVYKITGNEFVYYKSLYIKTGLNNSIANMDFMPGQNNILISFSPSGGESFRNVLINLDGDTLNTRLNYYHYKENKRYGFVSYSSNIHFKYNNVLHFKEIFSDTVFAIDQSNNIKPYLVLNCNKKHITPKILENLSKEHKIALNECFRVNNIMEVSRYLVFLLKFNNPEYYDIYDKTINKKFRFADKTFLMDDILGGVNFEPKFCEDGIFYSWIDVINLKKHVSSNNFKNSIVKNPEKKKALQKLTDSLKETDNPVLIIVTPKR